MTNPTRRLLPLMAPVLAAVLAGPLAANPGSVQDFQLPPAPTPTPSTDVQGPVDTEQVVPATPRVIASPAPSPSPTASPSPGPTATATRPAPVTRSEPQPAPVRTTAAAQPSGPQQPPATTPTEAAPPVVEAEPQEGAPIELPAAPEGLAPAGTAASASPADDQTIPAWLAWLGGLLAAGAAGGVAYAAWRRRDRAARVPTIEPPLARDPEPGHDADEASALAETVLAPAEPIADEPAPVAAPVTGSPTSASGTLTFEVEATRLTRSMMNARLGYIVRVTNGSTAPFEGVEISGDLIAAHNAAPVAQQIADHASALDVLHRFERIDPGETQFAKGDLAVPLAEIQPIFQGRTPLLVPLMRWTVRAAGLPPIVETHVVGMKPDDPAARLQPFRLDLPPQTFDRIGNRPVG